MHHGGDRPGAGRPKTNKTTRKLRLRNTSLVWLDSYCQKNVVNPGDVLSDLIDDSEITPKVYKDFKGVGDLLKDAAARPRNLK